MKREHLPKPIYSQFAILTFLSILAVTLINCSAGRRPEAMVKTVVQKYKSGLSIQVLPCTEQPNVKWSYGHLEWVKNCSNDRSYLNQQIIGDDQHVDIKFPEEPNMVCAMFLKKYDDGLVDPPLFACHPFRKENKKIVRLRIDPTRPGAWPERE